MQHTKIHRVSPLTFLPLLQPHALAVPPCGAPALARAEALLLAAQGADALLQADGVLLGGHLLLGAGAVREVLVAVAGDAAHGVAGPLAEGVAQPAPGGGEGAALDLLLDLVLELAGLVAEVGEQVAAAQLALNVVREVLDYMGGIRRFDKEWFVS